MTNICPVCGYDKLYQESYNRGTPSFEICPSCRFEFGVTDYDMGFTFGQWREKWIKEGMKFWWKEDEPKNWDPKRQLLNIGIKI